MRTTSHTRPIARSLAAAAAALTAAAVLATPAAAQGRWGRGGNGNGGSNGGYDQGGYGQTADGARTLYQWSGRVDREAYIVMQNGDVRTRLDSYDNNSGGRVRVGSALPQADGVIDVRVVQGRGRVDVVEQPSRQNNYRAVVRVRDDDSGVGDYRLVATWRPTGGYAGDGRSDNRGNGGYGNGGYGTGTYGSGDSNRGNGDRRDGDQRDRDGRTDGRYDNTGTYAGTNSGSGTLHWRGRVDDVEEIRIQGGRVDVRTLSGQGASNVRSQLSGSALPARDVAVRVDDHSGRGRVSVVQQPHAGNGYTAVVRVEDRDAGAGFYDFDISW